MEKSSTAALEPSPSHSKQDRPWPAARDPAGRGFCPSFARCRTEISLRREKDREETLRAL